MELKTEVRKVVEGINSIHSSVSSQDWGNSTQIVFVNSLEKAIDELKALQKRFKEVSRKLSSESAVGKPDLGEPLAEFGSTLQVLDNNFRLEKQKNSTVSASNIFESQGNTELYADLAARVQTLLLRARYMSERLNVFAARQSTSPLKEKGTARQIMDLLQAKEKEIEELRGKYEDIRKRSYLGYLQERTSVDLEQEIGVLSMKMGAVSAELRKEISLHRNQLEYIENSYSELKQRLEELDENFSLYSEKSADLIAMLKKERDYAKKVVLDVEHETLQLRNTYTNEMLSLQENKLKVKKEAEAKLGREIILLKKELREKGEMLSSFKKLAEDKAGKEKELEKKVDKLTLLLKTKEIHESIKRSVRKKKRKR